MCIRDRYHSVHLFVNPHGRAENPEGQHTDRDNQICAAAHGFNQTVDQAAQRTVVNQHVDISIGKYNQEQDIRRADIDVYKRQAQARPSP